jgi:hypothetical protein
MGILANAKRQLNLFMDQSRRHPTFIANHRRSACPAAAHFMALLALLLPKSSSGSSVAGCFAGSGLSCKYHCLHWGLAHTALFHE